MVRSVKSEPMARIWWFRLEDGGRPAPPPGPRYSTVARFERLAESWPMEAWSVVLGISGPASSEGTMVANIRMLAGAAAPKELLESGSRFELYEGSRRVARGEIL